MLEEMLPPHYLEYREVFEKKDFNTLPERRPWDHVIEMTPDFKPTDCKVYPLTGDEQKALEEFLQWVTKPFQCCKALDHIAYNS